MAITSLREMLLLEDLNTKFKYEVVRVFHNDVLARQLEEGMRIENQQGISMNSQQEWNATAAP